MGGVVPAVEGLEKGTGSLSRPEQFFSVTIEFLFVEGRVPDIGLQLQAAACSEPSRVKVSPATAHQIERRMLQCSRQ